jgi:N-acetylglucosaminyl-diphospho-decaprenol L-rhamnosyltransferase
VSRVSVVVPSLRGGSRLVELARRLTGDGAEVRIADNGMPAPAAAELADSGATVVAMDGNAGFARAVNAAAAGAGGSALVVLNDDLELWDGFLDALVAPLDDVAMVAGVLLKAEAPGIVETAGIVIDRYLGAYDHLQDEPVSILDAEVAPPLGPSGGAAAFRREAFDGAGGYDPGFFAYFEDVDLAIRLRLAGERCVVARGARAVHVGSATLGYDSARKAALVGASRGRLVRKYGLLRSPGSGAWVLATETVTALELARRHRSLAPAKARWRGYATCEARMTRPPAALAGVPLRAGLRRRYKRSMRATVA